LIENIRTVSTGFFPQGLPQAPTSLPIPPMPPAPPLLPADAPPPVPPAPPVSPTDAVPGEGTGVEDDSSPEARR
ncbi:hypothetical protein ACFWIJ_18050, partial [Streptomyces sp. NPDC127079]